MTKAYLCFAYCDAFFSRIYAIFCWVLSSPYIVTNTKTNSRRFLAIYDLSSQPCSIGDFINFQQSVLVQCFNSDIEYVDVVFLNEGKDKNKSKEHASINDSNSLYYLASIIPVAQINRKLGSVLIFNSHFQLEQYIAANGKYYHIWPNAFEYSGKDYMYYSTFNDIFYNHNIRYGHLPTLICRDFLIKWAKDFYTTNIPNQVPITINLRNNHIFGQDRNSKIECWLDFFDYCDGRYNAKFIIICAFSEIDSRIRKHRNVIIAKDFYTGIEQDLALINTSAIHMGAASGPISMAWYGERPYLMFSWDADISKNRSIVVEDGYYRFNFSYPYQRMYKQAENLDLLKKEFDAMWISIDKSQYNSGADTKTTQISNASLSWLR